MNIGRYREGNPVSCYFHPKELLVGVCPLCLNERLLILAAKQCQSHHLSSAIETSHTSTSQGANNIIPSSHHKRPSINLPKLFGFVSFLNRHWKSDDSHYHDDKVSTCSQEGSFISIKFEGNGVASWNKGTVSQVSSDISNKSRIHQSSKKESKQLPEKINNDPLSVIEHGKPRASLRWQKRIGHLFQFIKWKMSRKGRVCHVGTKVEGVKVRRGWIRTLTMRRTKE